MTSRTALATLTALVTGGAGGLGRAIAETFLAASHNVAVCDVNAERLAGFLKEAAATQDGLLLAENTDITDEAAVVAFVNAVVTKFRRLDFVVNNAGMIDTFDTAGTTSKASRRGLCGLC